MYMYMYMYVYIYIYQVEYDITKYNPTIMRLLLIIKKTVIFCGIMLYPHCSMCFPKGSMISSS